MSSWIIEREIHLCSSQELQFREKERGGERGRERERLGAVKMIHEDVSFDLQMHQSSLSQSFIFRGKVDHIYTYDWLHFIMSFPCCRVLLMFYPTRVQTHSFWIMPATTCLVCHFGPQSQPSRTCFELLLGQHNSNYIVALQIVLE